MKGKGKGDRGSKPIDDCPLQFPSFKPVEHTRSCPRYTAVLNRDEKDCVGLEEVDTLQTELETLLASVAKRMRQLQTEIQAVTNWQEKNKEKSVTVPTKDTSISSPEVSFTSGKRGSKGKHVEEKPAKKMRMDAGRATYAQPSSGKSRGKGQVSKVPDAEVDGSPKTQTRAPRNDIPNRFWTMVEPYCADITSDDLRYLEEQIKACEDISEYMKIPSLGKHYTEKWAEEDAANNKTNDRKSSLISNGSSDAQTLLGRHDDSDEEPSPFGPLTQRLIQGLMEESMVTPCEDSTLSEADAVEAATVSPRSLAKQLHIGNTTLLERRIKRELEEAGILKSDDERSDDSAEDEILSELKRKQAELRSLSQQNVATLKRLHQHATDEMKRQELRKKMAAADNEVIEAYRKIQLIKAKKRMPTKREKDTFYKVLAEREAIVKEIDSIGKT